MAAPMSGMASDGTITFTGAVTGSSCAIDVNGAAAADGTVALPTVDTAALTDADGTKTDAGGTFFYMTLSGCTMTETNVRIYFEAGPNVDEATSGLINGGTSNVEVKLYKASEASVVGDLITPGRSTMQPDQLTDTGGTQWFYATYSTEANGAATAGTVSTSVTYSLIYF
jgi:major type 1 subunit fimbrin (pilin)